MDFVKQYWWIFAGLLVLVLFMSKGKASGGGVNVSQIGGGNDAAYLQATAADQSQRYGLINSLLSFDLSGRQLASSERLSFAALSSQERIAETNADAAAAAAASQAATASQAYQTQQYLAQQQLQAQLAALQSQRSAQSQSNWMSLLGTGLQTFLPILGQNLFGNSGSSGGGWSWGGNTGWSGGGWG